jgi:predicted XRE-type DNA-binding protein
VDSLAVTLPIAQRVRHLLQAGAMTTKQIAEKLDVAENSVTQAVNRKDRWFTKVPDQSGVYRIGLLQQR